MPRYGREAVEAQIDPMHRVLLTEQQMLRYLELVRPLCYRHRLHIPPFHFHAGEEPLVDINLDDGAWPLLEPGTSWAEARRGFTLRTTFKIPDDWHGPVEIFLPMEHADEFVHPEFLAYLDGQAHQGVNAYHTSIALPGSLQDGEWHLLALHGWLGPDGKALHMGQAELVEVHQATRDFIAMARVSMGVLGELAEEDPIRAQLLNALHEAFCRLELREPLDGGFYIRLQEALEFLSSAIAESGDPMAVDVIAVGHAHLDVAWLWPFSQTRLKAARTFSSVLRLMEHFPAFHFSQSQPQLYKYVAEDHPDLFDELKARVAEGRWEVLGGFWVEADANLVGAESLVRQLLLGRAYFRREFGDVEAPILWLPDTFGFPWSLPQLIKKAGLRYFMTTKLSWNQCNRIPYDSFWWQGLDGTRILSHFITTPDVNGNPYHTYGGDLAPNRVIGTWRNYQQKEVNAQLITAFGWGDGGGGPTREMLEDGRRLANHPGAPRVRFGRASDFFRNLEEQVGDRLPVWNGELYLENHRGTYTSQAWIKRANRKAEFLLHDAEFLAAWAALTTDYRYPHEELRHAWTALCRNQFHDILCGVCIAEAYKESRRDFEVIFHIGHQVREASLKSLSQQLPKEAAFIAVNPTSFGGPRIGLLPEHLDSGQTVTNLVTRRPLMTQPVEEGTLVDVPHIEAYGFVGLGLADSASFPSDAGPSAWLSDGVAVLENDLLRVEFDERGEITRIFDRDVGREVLPPGKAANEFQAFEDRPHKGEAWNIGALYDGKHWTTDLPARFSVLENGPLRAGLAIRRRILGSEILQRIYLYRNSRYLEFDNWADWQERNILLKVSFPVSVLSPEATYDIQWGNIRRPTHRNTSWDWARFEVPAHKWVDLSEGNYGVSIISDCKYGCDVLGNVMRLTLLRSPTHPDPNADQGEHRFAYGLLPHVDDWRAGTVAAAYALNDPLIVRRIEAAAGSRASGSLVAADVSNVIIETVKLAEDGQGIIVRLYENECSRSRIGLRTSFPIFRAYYCNLLEENESMVAAECHELELDVEPYQIVTLRLVAELDIPSDASMKGQES